MAEEVAEDEAGPRGAPPEQLKMEQKLQGESQESQKLQRSRWRERRPSGRIWRFSRRSLRVTPTHQPEIFSDRPTLYLDIHGQCPNMIIYQLGLYCIDVLFASNYVQELRLSSFYRPRKRTSFPPACNSSIARLFSNILKRHSGMREACMRWLITGGYK